MKLWVKIVLSFIILLIVLAAVLIPVKIIQGNKNRAAAASLKQSLMDFEARVVLQKAREESQQAAWEQQIEREREAIEQRSELEDEIAQMEAEAIREQELIDARNEELLARGEARRALRDNAVIPPSGNLIVSSGRNVTVNKSSGGYQSSRLGELELYLKSDSSFRYGSVNGQGLNIREWNDNVIRLENSGQLEGQGQLSNLKEVIVDVPNDLVWIRYSAGFLTLTELLPEKLWSCMEDAMGLNYCVPRNCQPSHSHVCISG